MLSIDGCGDCGWIGWVLFAKLGRGVVDRCNPGNPFPFPLFVVSGSSPPSDTRRVYGEAAAMATLRLFILAEYEGADWRIMMASRDEMVDATKVEAVEIMDCSLGSKGSSDRPSLSSDF